MLAALIEARDAIDSEIDIVRRGMVESKNELNSLLAERHHLSGKITIEEEKRTHKNDRQRPERH